MSKHYKHYSMVIQWSIPDDAYLVTVPELPGLMTHGETYEEAIKNGQEVIELWIAAMEARGERIPEPGELIMDSESSFIENKFKEPLTDSRDNVNLGEQHNGYSMLVQWSETDNVYTVTVPELPGCKTHGETYEEAVLQGRDAIQSWIDANIVWGRPIPKPRVLGIDAA